MRHRLKGLGIVIKVFLNLKRQDIHVFICIRDAFRIFFLRENEITI